MQNFEVEEEISKELRLGENYRQKIEVEEGKR